ncbi:MAG: CoA-binding protein [Planctomycetota bacterium]
MSEAEKIEAFLAVGYFAVIGASPKREKYGNKVLRSYIQAGKKVVPIHPAAHEVEGLKVFPSLTELAQSGSASLPAVSVITPPVVTERVLREAHDLGIHNVWLQPGAESETAILFAQEAGMNLIASGPCLLVQLGFRDI